jgi:hypothetical protein
MVTMLCEANGSCHVKAKQSKWRSLALTLSLCALALSVCASAQSSTESFDVGVLRPVMALYGLDEAGAAKRLSAEARAAEVDRLLFNGP